MLESTGVDRYRSKPPKLSSYPKFVSCSSYLQQNCSRQY